VLKSKKALLFGSVSGVQFVAGGTSTNTVAVSSSGAQVGDLLIVSDMVGGGATFTGATNLFSAANYDTTEENERGRGMKYAVLSSTSDITVTVSSGFCWAIYRGGASAALVVSSSVDVYASATVGSVTAPSPHATCIGQVLFAGQQVTAGLTPPSGFTERVDASAGSVRHQVSDRLSGVASGSLSVTGFSNSYPYTMQLVEIRS
jgi:hypothetical protein